MDNHRAFVRRGKKVTRAFKITEALDDAIISQAEKRGITPSSFISHVMTEYFEWWIYSSKGSAFVIVDRRVLTALMEGLDEEKIVDVARSIALITTREFLKFHFGKLDSETVLEFLDTLGLHMNWGDVKTVEKSDGGVEVLVTHELGIRWSIFVSEFIANLLSSYLDMQTTTEYSTFGCTVLASPM
jgi:hypothetical protein